MPEASESIMNLQIKSVEKNAEALPLTFSIPVRRILEAIWESRKTVAWIAGAVSIALILAKLVMAPSYTATAVLQVGLLDRDLLEQDSSFINEPNVARLRSPVMTDLSNLESQETRLLASEGLARSVVVRLGLDQAQSESKLSLLLGAMAYVLPVQYTAPGRADLATQKFMSTIDVRNEPRSNLIRVSVTADSPEEAARLANAVVAEYVHYRKAQMLALRKSRAAALISDLAVVYGPNHPNILRAMETRANTEAALEAHTRAPTTTEAELASLGYIMPARPDSTPTGLTLKAMILIAILAGLILGVIYVLLDTFLLRGEEWLPQLPKWIGKRPVL
jgi:uncharacterized protein involved in exopolysaccharide biosynthesis